MRIRAIARILKNYETKYGINTVKGLINRWAPPNENDTGAYVAHVARVLGVRPDQKIKVENHLPALVETIVIHENGYNPYSMETILDGIALA